MVDLFVNLFKINMKKFWVIEFVRRWYHLRSIKEAFDDTNFLFNDSVQYKIRTILNDFKLKIK